MSDESSASEAKVEPTKVFCGNLSFKTKEEDLRSQFESAGEVANVHIITRGPRSLGYGFVEMVTEEGAKKAVETLDQKELDGRQINVQIAKPKEESSDDAPRRGRGRGRGRRGARRGARGNTRGRAAGSAGSGRPREPSPTNLFVANLPFSVDDAALSALFSDYKVAKAHVVRKRNEKSKGFGFVEFENTEEQQRALKDKDGMECEGRQLSIKVALTEPAEENKEESGEGEAAESKQEESS